MAPERRAQDGVPAAVDQVGVGFAYSADDGKVQVTELPPGFTGSRAGLLPGDVIVKVNDTELTKESLDKLAQLLAGEPGTKVRLTVRHSGSEQPQAIELTRERFVHDAATGELLHPLRAAINERLAREPRHPGLHELRAELAGQWSGFEEQATNYTAAIEVLTQQTPDPAADLQRLYRRRGNAYLGLKKWQQALDDYVRIVTDATTDDALLSNQALAQANVLLERKPTAISATDDPMLLTHEQRVSLALKITDPWSKLAAAYRLHGDQPALDKLVERRPQAAAAIGDRFAADKEWKRAIEFYSKAISEQSTDVVLLSKRARAYEALKNWDAAAADWSGAATGNPDGARLLADFARRLAAAGQVALANGQFAKAQALYERSLGADPENDLVATELAQLLVAQAKGYHHLGDQAALDSLLKAHPATGAGIGDLYAADKNWNRAIAEYTKAITPEAKDAKLLARRAEAYEKLKKWDLAAADWTRASQQEPDMAFQRFKPVGAAPWRFETWNGGAGSMEVADGTLVFTTTVATGTNSHVQAYQSQLRLENGAEYVIRFKMNSPDSCTVTLFGSINQKDCHDIGLNETFVPPSEFKDYEFTFVPHDVVPGNNRIGFQFGANRGKVMVKEIVILKK